MATDREIALEQALIAVIASAETRRFEVKELLDYAASHIVGNGPYRKVDHPYVTMACKEIDAAHADVLRRKSIAELQ